MGKEQQWMEKKPRILTNKEATAVLNFPNQSTSQRKHESDKCKCNSAISTK